PETPLLCCSQSKTMASALTSNDFANGRRASPLSDSSACRNEPTPPAALLSSTQFPPAALRFASACRLTRNHRITLPANNLVHLAFQYSNRHVSCARVRLRLFCEPDFVLRSA